jgi:hypothetical protein
MLPEDADAEVIVKAAVLKPAWKDPSDTTTHVPLVIAVMISALCSSPSQSVMTHHSDNGDLSMCSRIVSPIGSGYRCSKGRYPSRENCPIPMTVVLTEDESNISSIRQPFLRSSSSKFVVTCPSFNRSYYISKQVESSHNLTQCVKITVIGSKKANQ